MSKVLVIDTTTLSDEDLAKHFRELSLAADKCFNALTDRGFKIVGYSGTERFDELMEIDRFEITKTTQTVTTV